MSSKKPFRPITPAGRVRIERELNDLWHDERPKIVNEVSEAAAMGDRSENAEYIYGKKRLREIDKRMGYLSKLLEKLTVIDPSGVKSDKIEFGATVQIEDEEGKLRSYQIVGEDEIDVKARKISMNSPMGKALMNKRVGDDSLVMRPAGELEIVVTKIEYK